MSTPISYWKSDPDYYSKEDPMYKKHIESIRKNLAIDKLITMVSSVGDRSYSIIVKK